MADTATPWNGEPLPMPSKHLLRASWPACWLPPDHHAWRTKNTRRALAVHEAGHAVSLLVGGPGTVGAILYDKTRPCGADGQAFADITQADIETPSDSTPPAINPSCTTLGGLWNAVIFHAGVQAELLDFGQVLPGELNYAAKDFDDARAALMVFPNRAPHGWCQQVARCLLSANWPSVQAIADVLLERGRWQADASTPAVKFTDTAALFAAAAHYDNSEF